MIINNKLSFNKKTALSIAITGILASGHVAAQGAEGDTPTVVDKDVEVIAVTGIRSSLRSSMLDKKASNVVTDGIKAEDLGKFPDLNVAESLQRITGVAIDRSGGEGQAVTIRGFGPQFNTVLVNGRQIATDSAGREFNFDVLAADQITGADIYKSNSATLQEGGIGGTVNVTTARPFDFGGLHVIGSVKGMYESLSEEVSPSASFLVSNTFNDDKLGVLFAITNQQRKLQNNQILTAGWRGGQTISNPQDGVLYDNAYIPRNWDQVVDEQDRERTNASLVLQYAPSDDITITVDGLISKFEVDSSVRDLASWFEPDRVGSATIDPETGTLLTFTQEVGLGNASGNPATDFVSHTRNSRDVTNKAFGINVDWQVNESLKAKFDVSRSTAENDRAGNDRFNVVGIINSYSFDGTGSVPTVQHDGFENGSLPDASLARLHHNEIGNQFTDEDEITEIKADFEYVPDKGPVDRINFGAYRQEREKSSFQIFGSQCQFCGYGTEAPLDEIDFEAYSASNYFPGLIDTFYSYDGDKMLDYLADQGFPVEPTLQNNRYTINEDITSLYMDFTIGFDLADMPVTVNMGARYSETDIEVAAVQSFISDVIPTSDATLFQNVFGPATDIQEGTSYSNLLPSFNVKLELQDNMILRFAAYDSITRPTMSQLSPATTFNEPRRQNLTASGGNPALKPFQSENWDISYEWYYNDANLFSFAVFSKEVDDFIVTLTGDETYDMTDRTGPDFACTTCTDQSDAELNGSSEVYTVSRPQNGESATVTGYEIGVTHMFENGFGFIANATVVDSDISVDGDTSQTFALEGLGDSQNLVLFYEQDNWQARVAFNNREGFLRLVDNGFNGEPVNVETYGQWDISASYDINENFTIFAEGINITEEELVQTGRFANQIYSVEDNGSRYAFGIRGTF
ncbi:MULTISPECIES: TonB-dependent receptor [unclassified Pseudoalteromonas]|uniref:TonB-dependent receptor n=1 Tax=unclassified Pseudoalteromonas TaxID=194690 RepID=UPI00235812F0|nr:MULTISPECIES: TonB-dependent receptor [unclassified Pseudoalteromonas]MDC9563779.1 TonB-dependent receptor [Pseudoalteromonas sp. GAB2316C]MDC9568812.1 TonB-dependent receptor [Pseudoalteromonas sp. GABNB9D]MDC9572452.1 TonB-dependent receptor [Pseudoalteromonas sp. GABNS16A]MDC9576602.1 TonB-dependent receptor [Pseudoalteromonas sp. GABNS16E]MDC9584195.1 TonB-dependent receptor [Pseudoalteromonas sp. GABNS16C]